MVCWYFAKILEILNVQIKVGSRNNLVISVGTNSKNREKEKTILHEIDRRTNDLYEKRGDKDE